MNENPTRLHRRGQKPRDKFTVDLKDMDFKSAEKRALANHTPLDVTLNTGRLRSRCQKFLDFCLAFGSHREPKGR